MIVLIRGSLVFRLLITVFLTIPIGFSGSVYGFTSETCSKILGTSNLSGDTLQEYIRRLNFQPGGMSQLRLPSTKRVNEAIPLKFGFESEYTIDWSDKLLNFYGPSASYNISKEEWLSWPSKRRTEWVRENLSSLFVNKREPGGLVLLNPDQKWNFLPQNLILDTTGNLELVLAPITTLEEWYKDVSLINDNMRTGSMQTTIGLASKVFFDASSRANIGFFKVVSDYDALSKLAKGAERFREDPTKEVARSFNHPFLGPMTKAKMEILKATLRSNSRGEAWDPKSLSFVSRSDASFKYLGTTVYRPDIAGPNWVVLEVRDAHSDMNILLSRVLRDTYYIIHGRKVFEAAADLPDFDSFSEFQKFPPVVRRSLKKIFPAKREAELEYSQHELFATEVYRNFAFPLRNWEAHLEFLGRRDLINTVDKAKMEYLNAVVDLSSKYERGEITKETTSVEIQGRLALFAESSGLAQAFVFWEAQQLKNTVGEILNPGIFYSEFYRSIINLSFRVKVS